jgi:hypothetical protein
VEQRAITASLFGHSPEASSWFLFVGCSHATSHLAHVLRGCTPHQWPPSQACVQTSTCNCPPFVAESPRPAHCCICHSCILYPIIVHFSLLRIHSIGPLSVPACEHRSKPNRSLLTLARSRHSAACPCPSHHITLRTYGRSATRHRHRHRSTLHNDTTRPAAGNWVISN